MRKAKATAIPLFIVALFLWVATITHDTLGFVAPVNPQSIGFDIWGAIIWGFLVYSIVRLYRTFRRGDVVEPRTSENDFEQITNNLTTRTDQRLREMINSPADKHHEFVKFLKEHGSADDVEKYRRGLLFQVMPLCKHAQSIHLSPSPIHTPGTPDSNGSLPKEIQKWAIMAAGIKINRALDIRAAMEVYKPFERMIQNRDYLLAIVKKNAGEDGTPTGNVNIAEFEGATGPEIAYRLITRANQDMFESEMWAYIAHYAGDEEFLNRYEEVGRTFALGSLEYWGNQVRQLNEI